MATDCALFMVTVPNDQDIETEHPSLCASLKTYLTDKINIEPVWVASNDQSQYQVTFYADFGAVSDRILRDLNKLEIGIKNGSQICVVPATLIIGAQRAKPKLNTPTMKPKFANNSELNSSENTMAKRKFYQQIDVSNFKRSVRARLMVHQVVAGIRAATALSFDFIVLVSLASMLAAFGLLENSSVIIVASMLISPLMNPIMGIVFGLSIRDGSLWKRGVRNELIGLVLCMVLGFILGLCTTHVETKWGSSSSFPTSEMKSRGDIKRLWMSALVALPSGAGVALSILGGNTASLVGVAISATLLSPAVNCGLLLAYALLCRLSSNIAVTYYALENRHLNNTNDKDTLHMFQFQHHLRSYDPIINCSKYIHNDYIPFYSCNMTIEAILLGGFSLLLTAVNIICIISMALIILRIKEVAPLHQDNEDITEFFHHDVKLARDYNKIIHDTESMTGVNHLATPRFSSTSLNKSISSFLKPFRSHGTHPDKRLSGHSDLHADIDPNTLADLNDLQILAKDFNLDIFNTKDRDLTTPDSEVKVLCLVNDLLDMYEESPPSFVDFYRFQPYGGVQRSAQEEQISLYESIIKYLPPKWHDLFDNEQQRRLRKRDSDVKRSNSNPTQTDQSHSRSSSRRSFDQPHREGKLVRFHRKISGPKIHPDSISIVNHLEEFACEVKSEIITNESHF